MPDANRISFVVAVNNRDLLESNFLASPCLREPHGHQILLQEHFSSAAQAYNNAIERSNNDLIVFCHQDVFLPDSWILQLKRTIATLHLKDPAWGVLGCYGTAQDGRGRGYVYSTGLGVIGAPLVEPVEAQTLDEMVLVLRKSSGLRFDEKLPNFHFYGTDICLRAAAKGMKSYAISCFCIHNALGTLVLPQEFYVSYRHIRRVWKSALPIHTTCVKITRFNIPMYVRRLQEMYLFYVTKKLVEGTRVKDPPVLLEELRPHVEELRETSHG